MAGRVDHSVPTPPCEASALRRCSTLADPHPPRDPRWPDTHPLPSGGRERKGVQALGANRNCTHNFLSHPMGYNLSCDHTLLQGRLGIVVHSGRTGIPLKLGSSIVTDQSRGVDFGGSHCPRSGPRGCFQALRAISIYNYIIQDE